MRKAKATGYIEQERPGILKMPDRGCLHHSSKPEKLPKTKRRLELKA